MIFTLIYGCFIFLFATVLTLLTLFFAHFIRFLSARLNKTREHQSIHREGEKSFLRILFFVVIFPLNLGLSVWILNLQYIPPDFILLCVIIGIFLVIPWVIVKLLKLILWYR